MSDESSSQQFLGAVGEDWRAASFGDLYCFAGAVRRPDGAGSRHQRYDATGSPLVSSPRFDPFGYLARAIYWLRSKAFERSLGVI